MGRDYACIVVTSDWHPSNHSSFTANGGQWAMHCVQHSVGSAIVESLLGALVDADAPVSILLKGRNPQVEEYSVFAPADSAAQFTQLMQEHKITQVDICGLAGDVCVLNTLRDGRKLYGHDTFVVLEQFSPSLDGGKALRAEM